MGRCLAACLDKFLLCKTYAPTITDDDGVLTRKPAELSERDDYAGGMDGIAALFITSAGTLSKIDVQIKGGNKRESSSSAVVTTP